MESGSAGGAEGGSYGWWDGSVRDAVREPAAGHVVGIGELLACERRERDGGAGRMGGDDEARVRVREAADVGGEPVRRVLLVTRAADAVEVGGEHDEHRPGAGLEEAVPVHVGGGLPVERGECVLHGGDRGGWMVDG